MAERGRPRSFDRDAALQAAMRVFWREGYQGASIADLTGAMGIAPPSLYAAFGDKRALYLEALALYGETMGTALWAVLADGDCDELRSQLRTGRAGAQAMLERRFERAAAEGELPRDADIAALARFYATIHQGLSIQARDGATAPPSPAKASC